MLGFAPGTLGPFGIRERDPTPQVIVDRSLAETQQCLLLVGGGALGVQVGLEAKHLALTLTLTLTLSGPGGEASRRCHQSVRGRHFIIAHRRRRRGAAMNRPPSPVRAQARAYARGLLCAPGVYTLQ